LPVIFLNTNIDLVFYDFSHRIRKEGDVLDVKINQACTFVINPSLSKSQNTDDEDPAERFQYDIFISYSHKHPKQAQTMIKMITEANPDLKIFFDRSELTMGRSKMLSSD
jgi:hypothetical protein